MNAQIEYLLVKRTLKRGGFWQPVTGGVEEGETLIKCLKREIEEEVGFKKFKRIIEKIHYFKFLDQELITEHVFGVEIYPKAAVLLDQREHSAFQWCNFEEAIRLMKWKNNKKALKKLNNILIKECSSTK